MRAMALALFAQALAIGIQIYAIFREIGKSERIVTIVVLVVASVQIILTRPRRKEPDTSRPGETIDPRGSRSIRDPSPHGPDRQVSTARPSHGGTVGVQPWTDRSGRHGPGRRRKRPLVWRRVPPN